MKFSFVMLLLLPVVVLAQSAAMECYRSAMADAIIKTKDRAMVFETYEKWETEGNSPDILDGKFKWAFRDGNGALLNDAELLTKIGQEEAAERMREIYRVRKNQGNVRLFVGVPLGIAMVAVGALWFDGNFTDKEPSTLDQAGALVLGISGVGVTSSATLSFISTRKIDPYKHDVTSKQSLDVLDRHNTATALKCSAKK